MDIIPNLHKMKFKMELSNAWKHSTNIYEVNIRQYTEEGTFLAFENELSRLKEMGIETFWFMPITPISQKNQKGTLGSQYAAQDYTAINPEFGTLEDFKQLVTKAHGLGFKVIIDWVANHTGWDHVWTKSNPDFYLKDLETNDFQIASGMDDIIELDYSNAEMRLAMIDAMKFWVSETNIDGFRCDLASWVQVDFWQQARPELEKLKPLFFLGEFDELESPEYGKFFDASYSWTWMHKTKDYKDGNVSFEELLNLLNRYSDLGNSSMRSWFTSNHDENTWNGTEYEKYGDLALPLAVFSVTWNGVPLMYNGQELPLKSKRLEFFEKDPIPWTGENLLQDFYKILLNLKSRNRVLRGGDSSATTSYINLETGHQILAYLRKNGEDEVLTFLNLSQEEQVIRIDDQHVSGIFKNIFDGSHQNFSTSTSIELKVGGFAVYEK